MGALVVRFFPAIAPQSTAEGSAMVVCASLDVASLDGTCSWAAAVAAAAHGVADAGGMTMVGRRHVKSSPIGRAVATEESEGALGGHVSFPRGVGSFCVRTGDATNRIFGAPQAKRSLSTLP